MLDIITLTQLNSMLLAIGRAIAASHIAREAVFITTKVWPIHLGYKNLIKSCERSLRRLATDFIDLYLIHIPNPFIPLEDTFRALNQLVIQGKVRNIGVSNFNLELLRQSLELCITPLITNQIPYSIFNRTYAQNGVIECCKENDILITAYSPLRDRRIEINPILRSIAREHSATPQQIALAWLTTQTHVITIPMSFNPIHLRENIESLEIKLSQEEMDQLTNL